MAERPKQDEATFDFSGVHLAQAGGPYQPLAYEQRAPDIGIVRRIGAALLNWWTSERLDWKSWRDRGSFTIAFPDPSQHGCEVRTQLDFDAVCAHLTANRKLTPPALGVPPPNANWMDASVALSVPAHAPCNQGDRHFTYVLPQGLGVFAEAMPSLDREGVAFSNVLLAIYARIVRLRDRLVQNSRGLFELDGEWHDNLRGYLGACVSSVDATLSRVFHRARHQGREVGWRLDRAQYPSARTVPRDEKMFAWLAEVTRERVDDRHGDYRAFDTLREVRHHLHHFDPPAFAMSIDDAALWLNLAPSVGSLLLSMRIGLRLPPPLPLIELLLAPPVGAVPHAPSLRRFAQPKDAGYASCRAERPLDL